MLGQGQRDDKYFIQIVHWLMVEPFSKLVQVLVDGVDTGMSNGGAVY